MQTTKNQRQRIRKRLAPLNLRKRQTSHTCVCHISSKLRHSVFWTSPESLTNISTYRQLCISQQFFFSRLQAWESPLVVHVPPSSFYGHNRESRQLLLELSIIRKDRFYNCVRPTRKTKILLHHRHPEPETSRSTHSSRHVLVAHFSRSRAF